MCFILDSVNLKPTVLFLMAAFTVEAIMASYCGPLSPLGPDGKTLIQLSRQAAEALLMKVLLLNNFLYLGSGRVHLRRKLLQETVNSWATYEAKTGTKGRKMSGVQDDGKADLQVIADFRAAFGGSQQSLKRRKRKH
jgi:hypothetical protein